MRACVLAVREADEGAKVGQGDETQSGELVEGCHCRLCLRDVRTRAGAGIPELAGTLPVEMVFCLPAA